MIAVVFLLYVEYVFPLYWIQFIFKEQNYELPALAGAFI